MIKTPTQSEILFLGLASAIAQSILNALHKGN